MSDSEILLVIAQQFAAEVTLFSSQYGNDGSISYSAANVTGKPFVFPKYGDFPTSYVMRTYGRWWKKSPSYPKVIMQQSVPAGDSNDFFDLLFEEAVYPLEIMIYENYNPGAVTHIWATDQNKTWKLLWAGPPQSPEPAARIFSPPIRKVNFKTRLIRIEINHEHLNYYCQYDAVLLRGHRTCQIYGRYVTVRINLETLKTSLTISPPTDEEDNSAFTVDPLLQEDLSTNSCHSKHVPACSEPENFREMSKEVKCILDLPDEMLNFMFSFLDLKSLSRCSQVNKRFCDIINHQLILKELNFKVYWWCTDIHVISKFNFNLIQKLDLSWCGSYGKITSEEFCSFLNNCGSQLSVLRLNCCEFVENTILQKIGEKFSNMKELSLRCCTRVTPMGFGNLSLLTKLEYLDLYRTQVDDVTMMTTLEFTPFLKHLNIGSCSKIASVDLIANTLGKYNTNLISLDMWKTYTLTESGLNGLRKCKKLQELDLGWCLQGHPGDGIVFLSEECHQLKKLFLSSARTVSDRDIDAIAFHCLSLEQLDLMGVLGVSPAALNRLLISCKNLRLLDISFCTQIAEGVVEFLKRKFPGVTLHWKEI